MLSAKFCKLTALLITIQQMISKQEAAHQVKRATWSEALLQLCLLLKLAWARTKCLDFISRLGRGIKTSILILVWAKFREKKIWSLRVTVGPN